VSGPSGRAPRRLYWLEVITIGKLAYNKRGGGKYTSLAAAQKQQAYLAGQRIDSVLYETEPITWKEVPND
jgi:hypothetical protein